MNKYFFVIFIQCFFISTASAQESTGSINSPINVNSTTFDNGLHVIHHYRPYSNTVTLQIVTSIGLQQFPCSSQQTPHILEHMLLSETKRYKEGEMRKAIKDLGGTLSGYTTYDYTHYTVTIHSDYIDKGLDILHSILFEAALSEKTLLKSITAAHAELGTTDNTLKKLINNKPAVTNLGIARLYTNSNLDCDRQSSPSDVTLHHAQDAYNNYYHPSNMTLIIVGNINNAVLNSGALNAYANLSNKRTVPSFVIDPLTLDSTPIVEHGKFSESRVHVNLLLPATGKRSGSTAEFQLISDYLGEQLFYDLRTSRGIAYSPRARYIAGSDLGYIHVTAETSIQWESSVTDTFLSHYKKLLASGIPEADVSRLKKKAILKMESREYKNAGIAQQIRHHRHHVKEHGKMPDILEDIRNISNSSLRDVVDQHFPKQPVLATLRPLNNNELILRLLLIVGGSALVALPLLGWLRKRRKQSPTAS